MWDMERCIFCRKCEHNCPTEAIITNREAKTQTVIRNRCIACNTCVEVCPTHTISMIVDYSPPDTAPLIHVFDANLPRWQYRVEHLPRYGGHKALPEGTSDSKTL